jgi:hypothetical protein
MIGYIEKAVDYFQDNRPKKAQSVPASLFWREEGLGIHRDKVSKTVNEMLSSGKTKLEYMPFNLFISEKHSLKFRVSDHPLQNGSTISDHVHQEMQECTIEGMFTNHPMRKLEEVNEVKFKDEYATSEVKPTVSNTALANFEKLKLLAKQRKPVRLVCSLEIYPKMVITGIDYDRDSKSGSSIRFTMTLRELKTVSLKATTGTYAFQPEELKTANDKLIASEKKVGKRTAEEISAEKAAAELKQIHDLEIQ